MHKYNNIIIFSLVFIILFFNINQSLALDRSSGSQFSNVSFGEYKFKVEENEKFEDIRSNLLNQLYKDHYEIYVKNLQKAEDLKTEMIVSSVIMFPSAQLTQGVDFQRTYSIEIGTDDGRLIKAINDLSLTEIRDIYKCSFIDENASLNINNLSNNNFMWKAYFKVECGLKYVEDNYILDVTATDIAEDPSKLTINSEDFSEPEHEEKTDIIDSAKTLDKMFNDFLQDAFVTLEKWFWSVLRTLCDWIQGFLNTLKNKEDGFDAEDLKIMYSFSSLNSEEGTSNKFRNNYTKVEEVKSTDGTENTDNTTTNTLNDEKSWQKQIIVDNKHEKFTKEKTNIPVITVEPYNMAKGTIKFFDINFLSPNEEDHGKAWNYLRNLATNFMHLTLYLSIVALLTILIIYGIRIVYSTSSLKMEIDKNFSTQETPEKVVNYKEGMKRYAISLALLVGVIVFMALCIFLSDWAIETLKIGNPDDLESDELPIRVTVEGVYSFSTNPIGYYRLMSVSDDISDQRMYSFIYVVLVIINILLVFFMIVRVVRIYILGIAGPIIIAMYTTNIGEDASMYLQSWAVKFFIYSSIQVIIAIFYKFLEHVLIK